MTIISNHRVHSYKASASLRIRDLSPKKISIRKNIHSKKHHTKQTTMPKINDEIQPSYILSTLFKALTNYTNGFQYKVIMPTEAQDDAIEDTDDDFTEDDMEEAWAHYDYLEWLYD
jgi:hypothetical protein